MSAAIGTDAGRCRPRIRDCAAATVGVLVCAALIRPVVARADFTGASLLSGTSARQFESANAPAIAQDGRYVAFQGSLAGVSGVWRRDLQTGAIEPVATSYEASAPGLSAPEPALSAPDAIGPSISANGRYVAFTTTADLEPQSMPGGVGEPEADRGCPEVYVRDMSLPATAHGAYTLASALEGGEGIAFEGCPSGGAQAAPGVALSADGQSVAFTVLSPSDLDSGSSHQTTTQPSQVAVHDLETGATTLVTVAAAPERTGQPVLGGGAFPSAAQLEQRLGGTPSQIGDEIASSTAAISGDGSTVSWMGTNVQEQVPGSGEGGGEFEVEPLWRRIAAGEDAITRRLLAGAGLDFSFSLGESGEVVRAGSFVALRTASAFVPPALSNDGEEVALVANAPRPAAVPSLTLSGLYPPQSDAYAVRVSGAPALAPQVTPITETPDYDTRTGAEGFVKDVAISPDGSRIAFESQRDQFTLPALALVSQPATSKAFQTYEANLALGTLQRVTSTYDGAEPTGNAGLISISGTGDLVFASQATNLFYGDAIEDPQVYLAHEVPSTETPASEQIQVAPLEPLPHVEWKLNAIATAQPDGSVLVHAEVPGAGRLLVQADAQLPASTRRLPRRRARRAASRGAARSSGASGSRRPTHTVAQTGTSTSASASVSLRLRVKRAYRTAVVRRNGLYAVLQVSFLASGRQTLRVEIPVTFHRASRSKPAKGARRAIRGRVSERRTAGRPR